MTQVIQVQNVNEALCQAIWNLKIEGKLEKSRNGDVLVAPAPVITEFSMPWERVLFCPRRDANHVFHLMEAIWMLAGENNVDWLLQFNSTFGRYAEEDGNMHGAYGYRWRRHFNIDQILAVRDKLYKDPTTRQAVISMWSPHDDLLTDVKDRPCNTHIYFDLRGGKLNMMVCCRSNDMLWGAYGSNVVHFSILQELLARSLGVRIGTYYQMSFNFHMYLDLPLAHKYINAPPDPEEYDEYRTPVRVVPLLTGGETMTDFLRDCEDMVRGGTVFDTRFFSRVAHPLMRVYLARKAGLPYDLGTVAECDWKVGFEQWLARRNDK